MHPATVPLLTAFVHLTSASPEKLRSCDSRPDMETPDSCDESNLCEVNEVEGCAGHEGCHDSCEAA